MLYVIIPVYNCEKYLEEAVSSVLAQPWKDIRIVIVDDGSTDASGQIADSLAAQHEAVTVLHQKNGGVSAARNAGIEHVIRQDTALDGYIAFLDADDLWAKNAVDEEIAALMRAHEYDLLCFNMCHVNETLTRSDVPVKYEEMSFAGGVKAVYRHPQHFGSILYSVCLIAEYGIRFSVGLQYNEDNVFKMCCLYLARRIHRLPGVLYLYRLNPDSSMHTRTKGIPHYLRIIDGWLEMDVAMNCWRNVKRGELKEGHTLASLFMLEMAQEHYWCFGSRKTLEKALKTHPHYPEFLQLKENCVSAKRYSEYLLFREHPSRYQWKNYLVGVVRWLYYTAFHLPMLKRFYERKKYPLKNAYV